MTSRAQIIATIGPASKAPDTLSALVANHMDLARINFGWSDLEDGVARIDAIRAAASNAGIVIPIIADLPGPRTQNEHGHSYDSSPSVLPTPHDEDVLRMCVEKQVEYAAISFVASAEDIERYRVAVTALGGVQKLIAKIERKAALENLDGIIEAADAVMVARGDLGKELPLEEVPFAQKTIIAKANAAGKPVITATQMLFSMVDHAEPTRAEVTDVEEAVRDGSDAVMLSEETASGRYPVEAVAMMERILSAAERHYGEHPLHPL